MYSGPPDLGADIRGAVYAEYLVILILVSLGACAALAVSGWSLLEMYQTSRFLTLLPVP